MSSLMLKEKVDVMVAASEHDWQVEAGCFM